jgi:hypothetical protein
MTKGTDFPIPDAALDDRLAFIGTSGSGKTYNAAGAVERLLESSARVAIVDPLGVWYGLRLNADGSPSSYKVVIFGGPHGDLPLNENAGALIGETVATMAESCIIDLSGLTTKSSERRFMLAFLDAVYRHTDARKTDPYHMVFDEADLWAPQRSSEPMLQSRMEEIVRRGRIRGFIPWLITQRPAVLSKDVLSQVDGLVAFRLTASQDRKAIGEWVKGQADEGQWPTIDATLPTMQRGQGIVWAPAHGILKTVQFPPKRTFDSSRTPTRGERRQTRNLRSLNLEALKGRLASIEEETKANDPKVLKAENARLARELAAEKKKRVPPAVVPALAPADSASLSEAHEEGRQQGIVDGLSMARDAIAKIKPGADMATPGRSRRSSPIVEHRQRTIGRQLAAPTVSDGSVPHGCSKPLAALAGVYPAGLTDPQWATAAGYKRKGGTWGAYKTRLRGAGLIEHRDGKFFATETGANAAGSVQLPPPPGPDLARWWAGKIHGTPKMVEALIESYPDPISKEDLADRLEMAVSGGSFGAYLTRLSGPGLITRDGGMIRLSEDVMERA